MYSDDELDSAVQAGIISKQAAQAFRDHVAAVRDTTVVDDEHFRLITGFNDVYVVIACILLLISVTWLGNASEFISGPVLQTITAWLLAEYFTRKRHMALPSIVLLLAFVGGTFFAGVDIIEYYGMDDDITVIIPGLLAATFAWLHWRRFKVPITVAAGVGALVGTIVLLVVAIEPDSTEWMSLVTFIAGIIVFWVALRWDMSDTHRLTRRSDVAFWLHLLAAPLLVHPAFYQLGVFEGDISLWQATVVVFLYVLIALVSLSVDRRALMVSALAYVLYAFSALLEQYGVIDLSFALTSLVIGGSLLLLSAFWHDSRSAIVRHYPAFIRDRLAPLN